MLSPLFYAGLTKS